MTAHVDETDGDGDATLRKKSAFQKSPFFRAIASKKAPDDADVESQLQEKVNRLLAELADEIATFKHMRFILQTLIRKGEVSLAVKILGGTPETVELAKPPISQKPD